MSSFQGEKHDKITLKLLWMNRLYKHKGFLKNKNSEGQSLHQMSRCNLKLISNKLKVKVKVTQSCPTLQGVHRPWNSPGQNIGTGSLSLLQGIFPTQGSNPGFPHCRWILYQLSHKGSPRKLKRIAYFFSRGFSQPRNQTGVSCIAGGFFTNWAIRKAQTN